MIWFTRAVVLSFAGAVALVGVGLMRAGQLERNDDSESWDRKMKNKSFLENVGVGLFAIGLIGALVTLAG